MADPFIFKYESKYFLFCEAYMRKTNKGVIRVFKINDDLSLEDLGNVIEQEYHMSYPHVFNTQNGIYMIPETSGNRTIELYKQIGAEFRMMKDVTTKLCMDASKVLSPSETEKMTRALGKLDQIRSKAEDHMFKDHPEVTNDYLSVFYGNLGDSPNNPIDEEVAGIAKKVADELFK